MLKELSSLTKEEISKILKTAIRSMDVKTVDGIVKVVSREFIASRPRDLLFAAPLLIFPPLFIYWFAFGMEGIHRRAKVNERLVKLPTVTSKEETLKFVEEFLMGKGGTNLLSLKYLFCSKITGISAKNDKEAGQLVNSFLQCLSNSRIFQKEPRLLEMRKYGRLIAQLSRSKNNLFPKEIGMNIARWAANISPEEIKAIKQENKYFLDEDSAIYNRPVKK